MKSNHLKGEDNFMSFKKICYLTLAGFLLKGGYGVVQAASFDDIDRPIAIMEDSNGTLMDSFYLGEGVTVFFHPETREFQCTAIASNTNLEEYQNLNYQDSEDIETFVLQEVENLFGEDSVELQTLTERIIENSQEKNVRASIPFSKWTITPHSSRQHGESIYSPSNGTISVQGTISSSKSDEKESRTSLTVGLVQSNGTHTSFSNSSSSFDHKFTQLPAGNWFLKITNNYSIAQYFTGSMYN